jgi:hypothetical protein
MAISHHVDVGEFEMTPLDTTARLYYHFIFNFPSSPNPLILGVWPVALKSVQLLPPTGCVLP